MINKKIKNLSMLTMSSLIVFSSMTFSPIDANAQTTSETAPVSISEAAKPITGKEEPKENIVKENQNSVPIKETEKTEKSEPVKNNEPNKSPIVSPIQEKPANINYNPYDIKIGDTIYANNFKYASFPLICFHKVSCVFTPNVNFSVTDIKKDKKGTRFILSGFAGYKDMPLFNEKGDVVAFIGGSNGGMTYAYLKSQEELDSLNAKSYKLDKGIFNNGNKSSSLFAPKYAGEVDNREIDVINNVKEPSQHGNGKYIKSVEYNPSSKQYKIIPQDFITPGIIDTIVFSLSFVLDFIGINPAPLLHMTKFEKVNSYWSEVVQMGVPNTDSMRQQFECHYRAGAFKKDWKLELGRRPLHSVDAQMLYLCNPPK